MPVVISFPHFYMAEDRYIDGVVGMHPDEQYVTEVKLEPVSNKLKQLRVTKLPWK